ncbi:MAG TPA: hypothetical protein VFF73_39850 [Planctomycetota bacterium]|nr:hypothetical protein [Planctomycetota bacterium]
MNAVPERRPAAGRVARGAISLVLALALWLAVLHVFFAPPADVRGDMAPRLLAEQLRFWTDPELRAREVERMRAANNEWDFMGRSFLVWSLAEIALREPATRARNLEVMDRIIDETIAVERERGIHFFLMSYSKESAFRVQPPRSLFLDGEIALMLGARRLVEEKPEYRPPFAERVRVMEERMRKGPVLCAESYPDECWIFCNTAALAAMRFSDVLDGTDHRAFFAEWLAMAKKKLVDPTTGILVSSFTLDGRANDGPEGSSIWFASHCLRLVDEAFARDQYERARRELARSALGFAWAREWPSSWVGAMDVDSGPVVPIVEASAGSSGTAFVAASSFDDRGYYDGLLTSLDFAGFPIHDGERLHLAASNQVGDAVLLYSMVLGPLWRKVGAP